MGAIPVPAPRRVDVQQAREDLSRRTLSDIPRPLDRLIYLASMRDYNTGFYHHDGLASRFSQEVACEALADCHREVFRELVVCPLEDLVSQLEAYRSSTHTGSREFLTAWKRLEPYRVAVPVETDTLSAEFLFSNFKIALAILEVRLDSPPVAQVA
jgi:hypothetical protein